MKTGRVGGDVCERSMVWTLESTGMEYLAGGLSGKCLWDQIMEDLGPEGQNSDCAGSSGRRGRREVRPRLADVSSLWGFGINAAAN